MAAQIMIFALGFLTATLLALLALPAIRARAERLARRRIEAALPLSMQEISAQRDLIRAEGAVAERRKDQVIAEKNEALHRQMVELSSNRSKIESLEAALAAMEAKLQHERARADELERRLAGGDAVATEAENAALRQRIEELADAIMARSEAEEKSASTA